MRATMIAKALDASTCPRFGRRRDTLPTARYASISVAVVAERVGFEPTNTR